MIYRLTDTTLADVFDFTEEEYYQTIKEALGRGDSMRKISLEFVATEDSITVYWERTKEMAAGDPFRVFLDGGEAACTEKTYYTLAGLLTEHGYRVRVSGAFGESEELYAKTLKKKWRINITDLE